MRAFLTEKTFNLVIACYRCEQKQEYLRNTFLLRLLYSHFYPITRIRCRKDIKRTSMASPISCHFSEHLTTLFFVYFVIFSFYLINHAMCTSFYVTIVPVFLIMWPYRSCCFLEIKFVVVLVGLKIFQCFGSLVML